MDFLKVVLALRQVARDLRRVLSEPRSWCELGCVHRWVPLNERQLDVLTRIAAGEDLGAPEHSPLRASANAVRNRGLVAISKRGGVWRAEVTVAGQYYLELGRHPDHSLHGSTDPAAARPDRQPSGTRGGRPDARSNRAESPAAPRVKQSVGPPGPTLIERRPAAAEELVARLIAERRVVVSAPTEAEATYWRQVVDFAKRRSLVPEGHRIEKQQMYGRAGDLQISLRHGLHANSQAVLDGLPRVAVPDQLRAPHPVVAALRDDPGRLVMPKELRRRSLLVLQGLAAEATRRGHVVRPEPVREGRRSYYYRSSDGPQYSLRSGEFRIVVGGFDYEVKIQQECPQSPRPERWRLLVLELGYHRDDRQRRWVDRKVQRVEDVLGLVLKELETRADEDRQHRIDEDIAKAERKVRWERAMVKARQEATQAHFASILEAQAKRWRHADQLRSYCEALERRLSELAAEGVELAEQRRWLTWAVEYADRLDPLHALPVMPSAPDISEEDLQPFLGGWSPYGPEERLNRWPR